jgi:hypothetical protein
MADVFDMGHAETWTLYRRLHGFDALFRSLVPGHGDSDDELLFYDSDGTFKYYDVSSGGVSFGKRMATQWLHTNICTERHWWHFPRAT